MISSDIKKNNFILKFALCFLGFLITWSTAQTIDTNNNGSQRVVFQKGSDGNIYSFVAAADDDGDGIENVLEINGFTYDVLNGLQEWTGDTTVEYYKTDPRRWSTDGDPYSDYMEVTGINMPSAIAPPENHPLVAARPIIIIKMDDYDVIPIETITDTKGGEQSSSFTNETSTSNTVSASVTVEAELNPFKMASASVTAGYSHTWSSTQSSTSTFGTNWSNTRTTSPNEAAELRLRIYMENIGGATALDVEPTINLKLGKKVIATFIPDQIANILSPPGTGNSRFPQNDVIVVDRDKNNNKLIISLDDLKAIQAGTPLSLEVVQVSAHVVRWNPVDEDWNSEIDWAGFESDIDPVSVEVRADFGNGENYRYEVFAGSQYWDPQFTLKDIASLIFEVDKVGGQDYIEQRKYPEKWYLSSPSQEIITAWNNAGQPQNMFDVPITKNTKLVMMSPGSSPSSIVNLATYTGDYSRVIVSAIPNNFPILSVKADVPVNGEIKTYTLKQNNTSFFINDTLIEGIPDGPGTVYVTNARGDVTTTTIQLPSFYSSAQDVKDYSSFIPEPGGDFWLFPDPDSNPVLLYCLFQDPVTMEELTTAREYLSIHPDALENNYSMQADGNGRGHAMFSKIRINPATLKLDPSDQTFRTLSWTEGEVSANVYRPGSIYFHYPYNNSDIPDTARAAIDLSGTPYSFDPKALLTNYTNTSLSTFMDRKRQKFEVEWTAPGNFGAYCCTYVGFEEDSIQLINNYEGVSLENPPTQDNLSLQFNETRLDGYVNAGDSDSLKVTGDFTVEAWINPTGIGSPIYGGVILNKEGEYEFARWYDGSIRFALANNSPGWTWSNTIFTVPENTWSHVAFVYNQENMKAYFNGVLFTVIPATGAIGDFHATLNELRVGNRQSGGQPFEGFIDDVRIWNKARSAHEIKSTYKSKLAEQYYTSADSGLIGYWNFDNIVNVNDSTLMVEDLSIYGNDGISFGDVHASEILTDIELVSEGQPNSYDLDQNYPNPFNPVTTINYGLKKTADIKLAVYNIMGQLVKTLVSERQPSGVKSIQWNGLNNHNQQVASGTYIYAMFINGQLVKSKKMVLVR